MSNDRNCDLRAGRVLSVHHRRVIGIRHEPTPKAQKWHCKEELKPAENDKKEAVSLGDGRYKCPCGYISDPAKGNPKQNIPAGTQFENCPDDWRCPRCKRKKEKFQKI